MQEIAFPGFKFQIFLTFCAFFPLFISNTSINFQKFSGGVLPQTHPPFKCGILATHVAFSHCYPPLIYYLTERSLFKKCPPTGKSLKKALDKSVRFSPDCSRLSVNTNVLCKL